MWSVILNDFEHHTPNEHYNDIFETVNECFNFYKTQSSSKEMYIFDSDSISKSWVCFKQQNDCTVCIDTGRNLQYEMYNKFILGEFTHL
jgi:CTP:phosphocholine cytidylyltransferase-like protein